MSVKPILFNTEMVQRILADAKTTTRRPIKPTSKDADRVSALIDERTGSIIGVANCCKNGSVISDIKPPYQKGDILYVRETWNRGFFDSSDAEDDTSQWFEEYHQRDGGFCDAISHYIYRADFTPKEEVEYGVEVKDGVYKMPWKPSIHMPKEAARIWLRVTNVRIERVEDITEEQAHAEGFYRGWQHPDLPNSTPSETARQAFMWVWHKLYGILNDYVWVIEFTRIEKLEEQI